MNISHHFKSSFPAQVTKETEFPMSFNKCVFFTLKLASSVQGGFVLEGGSEGWEERSRGQGQQLLSPELIKGLGSGFGVSPRVPGTKTIFLPPLWELAYAKDGCPSLL